MDGGCHCPRLLWQWLWVYWWGVLINCTLSVFYVYATLGTNIDWCCVFLGHYIVICGYDADSDEFEIRDPASCRYNPYLFCSHFWLPLHWLPQKRKLFRNEYIFNAFNISFIFSVCKRLEHSGLLGMVNLMYELYCQCALTKQTNPVSQTVC